MLTSSGEQQSTCGCFEFSQKYSDGSAKSWADCGITADTPETMEIKCCYWKHFIETMALYEGDQINSTAFAEIYLPPEDPKIEGLIGECVNIGKLLIKLAKLEDNRSGFQ